MFTADEIRKAPKGKRPEMIRKNLEVGHWIWVARALVVIYEKQTADERVCQTTSHSNGVGFNGADARFLSSLAEQVKWWEGTPFGKRQHATPLSERQLAIARKKIVKYSRQLADEVDKQATTA